MGALHRPSKHRGRILPFEWSWATIILTLVAILTLSALLSDTLVFALRFTSFFWSSEYGYPQDPQSVEDRKCLHTAQGKLFITDDKGYTCKWRDLDPSSQCCAHSGITAIERYSCQSCNQSSLCCSVYEFCVSCCMDPAFEDIRQEIEEETEDLLLLNLAGPSATSFDYCRAICRTSSRSLQSPKEYKNDEKYCFGKQAAIGHNRTLEDAMQAADSKVLHKHKKEQEQDEEDENETIGGRRDTTADSITAGQHSSKSKSGSLRGIPEERDPYAANFRFYAPEHAGAVTLQVPFWLHGCTLAFILMVQFLPIMTLAAHSKEKVE